MMSPSLHFKEPQTLKHVFKLLSRHKGFLHQLHQLVLWAVGLCWVHTCEYLMKDAHGLRQPSNVIMLLDCLLCLTFVLRPGRLV